MIVPKRNDLRAQTNRSEFRDAYSPSAAWTNVISAYQMLPALRGFWPMSSIGDSGAAVDLSGQGRHLTPSGSVSAYSSGLRPFAGFNGGHLYRADEAGLDITGTESYIAAANRGCTLGGWFYHANAAGTQEVLMSKTTSGAPALATFWLARQTSGLIRIYFGSGAGFSQLDSATVPAVGAYYFAVARFTPATEAAVFVNATKAVNTTSIIASLNNNAGDFNISKYSSAALPILNGRASLCFLCASALSDTIIRNLYHQTRALFGV